MGKLVLLHGTTSSTSAHRHADACNRRLFPIELCDGLLQFLEERKLPSLS